VSTEIRTRPHPLKRQVGSSVRLYLPISESDTLGGQSALYYKDLVMAFLPVAGDRVHLGYDAEDDESNRAHEVKSRYWEHDGTAVLQMKAFRVDPPNTWNWRTDGKYECTWFTSQEGINIHDYLQSNGWNRY